MHRILLLALLAGTLSPCVSAGEPAPGSRTTVRLGLLRAVPEKWNLEANFEVFLGNDETIVAVAQDLQTFLRRFGERRFIE